MPGSSAAPSVSPIVGSRSGFGLIGDRLSSPETIAKNGKNFTNASAGALGGHGAAIALLRNYPNAIDQLLKIGTSKFSFDNFN
jgi:hypothetical protein